MATSPDKVRHGLTLVTKAAQADIRAVAAAAGENPARIRAALFEAAPLVVGDYGNAAAALALDWYEELREAAGAPHAYRPRILRSVTDDDVAAMVAETTVALHDLETGVISDATEATRTSLTLIQGGLQKQVASGFWDTATGNTRHDPDAVGWARYAGGGACKFCQMLAGRGAVYRRDTVNFAAHHGCHCVVGPSYDASAPRASVMQYLGSQRTRTPQERAAVRDYLNHNFPDAPG